VGWLTSEIMWAWIGKLGTLVGLIGGLYAGLRKLFEWRASIVARGEYFNLSVPRPIQDTIRTLLDALNPAQMKQYIGGEGLTESQRAEAARGLHAFLDGQIDSRLRQQFQGLSSAWRFTIQNRGGKEVTELVLESPLEGVYALRRNGTEDGGGPFKHRIPLGSLRGSNSIDVIVWAWYGSGSIWTEREIRITHPHGKTAVQFPRRMWFIPGSIARFFSRKPARWA